MLCMWKIGLLLHHAHEVYIELAFLLAVYLVPHHITCICIITKFDPV